MTIKVKAVRILTSAVLLLNIFLPVTQANDLDINSPYTFETSEDKKLDPNNPNNSPFHQSYDNPDDFGNSNQGSGSGGSNGSMNGAAGGNAEQNLDQMKAEEEAKRKAGKQAATAIIEKAQNEAASEYDNVDQYYEKFKGQNISLEEGIEICRTAVKERAINQGTTIADSEVDKICSNETAVQDFVTCMNRTQGNIANCQPHLAYWQSDMGDKMVNSWWAKCSDNFDQCINDATHGFIEDKWDLALLVVGFIPGLGVVGWGVRGLRIASKGLKVLKMADKAIKTVPKGAKLIGWVEKKAAQETVQMGKGMRQLEESLVKKASEKGFTGNFKDLSKLTKNELDDLFGSGAKEVERMTKNIKDFKKVEKDMLSKSSKYDEAYFNTTKYSEKEIGKLKNKADKATKNYFDLATKDSPSLADDIRSVNDLGKGRIQKFWEHSDVNIGNYKITPTKVLGADAAIYGGEKVLQATGIDPNNDGYEFSKAARINGEEQQADWLEFNQKRTAILGKEREAIETELEKTTQSLNSSEDFAKAETLQRRLSEINMQEAEIAQESERVENSKGSYELREHLTDVQRQNYKNYSDLSDKPVSKK